MNKNIDKNRNRQKVLSEFECYGKNMVIVRVGSNVHVIPVEEWKIIYGRSHPERWMKKTVRKRIAS